MTPDPNWADVATAIAAIVAAVGVGAAFIAVLLTWRQLLEARRARLAEMTSDLSQRWDEDKLLWVRRRVSELGTNLATEMQELRAEKHEDYFKLLREPNYLEDLGVLVRHEGIEFGVIQDSFGYLLVERWNRWRPFVEWLREEAQDETFLRELRAARAGHHQPTDEAAALAVPLVTTGIRN